MNGTSPAVRSKRKDPPHSVDGRHPKHHRPNGDVSSAASDTPESLNDFEGEYDDDFDEPKLSAVLPAGPDTAEWQATIQRVVRSVVSIRFCQTCSFDTDPALTSEATGFVVDAERGSVFFFSSFPSLFVVSSLFLSLSLSDISPRASADTS